MYGDSECHDLREALAAHHGVTPAHIIIGEGIDGLLGMLVRMLVAPGDPVVTSDGAYPTFNYHVAGLAGVAQGALSRRPRRPRRASGPREDWREAAVFLQPRQPDGHMAQRPRGRTHGAGLPEGTLMVLDEAYIDAAPRHGAPDRPGRSARDPNADLFEAVWAGGVCAWATRSAPRADRDV